MKITQVLIILLVYIALSLTACVGSGNNIDILNPALNPSKTFNSNNSAIRQNLNTLQKYTQGLTPNNNKLLSNDGMDDNDVASNIVRVDLYDEPSSTYIYADNQSDYDVRLVGCESAGFMQNHLEDEIPAHSYAPRTIKYDEKWKAYDGGDGILDKDSRSYNYLTFNNSDPNDSTLKCYYKVNINDAGVEHNMYYAMVNHVYKFNTFFKTIDTSAQAQAAHYAFKQSYDIRKIALETGLPVLALFQVPWLRYASKYSFTTNNIEIVTREVNRLMEDKAYKLTRLLQDYNFAPNKELPLIQDNFSKIKSYLNLNNCMTDDELKQKLLAHDYNRQSRICRFTTGYSADRSKIELQIELTRNGGTLSASRNNQEFAQFFNNNTAAIAKSHIETPTVKLAQNNIIPDTRTTAKNIIELYTPEEISALEVASKNQGFTQFHNNLISEETGKNKFTQWMIKKRISKVGATLLASIGSSIDIILIGMSFLYDAIYQNAPWGNYHTTQNFLSLAEVSPADAEAWNKATPERQIKANTKLTPPKPDAPDKGNSPLMHSGTLTFNDTESGGVDSQLAVTVSLEALSTPNKRLDYINPQAPKDDPFLGNLDFAHDDKNPAVWSSVIHMNISNNIVSPIQEIKYQGQLLQMEDLGLTSLAQDERMEAPHVVLTQITNLKPSVLKNSVKNSLSNKVIFVAPNQNSNLNPQMNTIPMVKSLLSAKNGLIKVGALEGIILNTNQELTLEVALPKVSPTANNTSETLFGGGLGVSYIGEDESGSQYNFTPIKSDGLREAFDSESDGPSYLHSKFIAPYPLPLGDTAQLKLRIGGYSDNKRHEGHLYIADSGSKVRAIPVYVNAHLILGSNTTTIDPQGILYPSDFTIRVQNMGGDDYQQLLVTGLPEGIKLIPNPSGADSCGNGVSSGNYCELTYAGANLVANTNYNLLIKGLTARQILANDKGSDDPNGADTQSYQLSIVPSDF